MRLIGLRSLSKITAFDFVITLASGSLLATAASASDLSAKLGALVAIGTLLVAQLLLSWVRNKSQMLSRALQNRPSALFWRGRFLHEAMSDHRVAKEDILAKCREANVKSLSDVTAVVLETTGELSVISDGVVSDEVMEGVSFPVGLGPGQSQGS